MTARLSLVRHARPAIAPNRCYGRLDVAVDAQDHQGAALALASSLPLGAVLWHSTLQRCELLAQTLQGLRPDFVLKPCPAIVEMDFGRWEGQPWEAIARAEIDAWCADLAHYRPGGGESLAAMLARVAQALEATVAAHGGAAPPPVWIAHAGVARCVQWMLAHPDGRLPQVHEWNLPAPGFGQCLAVDLPAPGHGAPWRGFF